MGAKPFLLPPVSLSPEQDGKQSWLMAPTHGTESMGTTDSAPLASLDELSTFSSTQSSLSNPSVFC